MHAAGGHTGSEERCGCVLLLLRGELIISAHRPRSGALTWWWGLCSAPGCSRLLWEGAGPAGVIGVAVDASDPLSKIPTPSCATVASRAIPAWSEQ